MNNDGFTATELPEQIDWRTGTAQFIRRTRPGCMRDIRIYNIYRMDFADDGTVFYGFYELTPFAPPLAGPSSRDAGERTGRTFQLREVTVLEEVTSKFAARRATARLILDDDRAVNRELPWYFCDQYIPGDGHYQWHIDEGTSQCPFSLAAKADYIRDRSGSIPLQPWHANRSFNNILKGEIQ